MIDNSSGSGNNDQRISAKLDLLLFHGAGTDNEGTTKSSVFI